MYYKNIKLKILFSIFLFSTFSSWSQYKGVIYPLINEKYGQKIQEYIRNSQKSIYIIMFETGYYENYPDSISNQILKELINAARRNVKVEVILDATKIERVKKKNLEVAMFLAKNGIKVYFDKDDKTTHAKVVIIDEKYLFIGSHNWNYYSLSKNNETSLLIESEELSKYFIGYFEKIKNDCKIFVGSVH